MAITWTVNKIMEGVHITAAVSADNVQIAKKLIVGNATDDLKKIIEDNLTNEDLIPFPTTSRYARILSTTKLK